MADTSSKAKSYFIRYGFLGGRQHSRGLERALQNHGYEQADSIQSADILIVHSAGYYLLPSYISPKIVLLAAPALPRKAQGSAAYLKANANIWLAAYRNGYFRKRLYWSACTYYYGARHPLDNWRIMTRVRRAVLSLPPFEASKVLCIANRDDPWPHGPAMAGIAAERPWIFLELPGSHEQLWSSPEMYVELLDRYAK